MNIATNEFSEYVLFSEDENNALDSRSETREVRGKPTTYVNCLVGRVANAVEIPWRRAPGM